MATLLASSRVKLPEIWPEPPVMGSRITGAEITLSSSTIAKGLPTFSEVMWAKRRVPRPLKRNEAIGSFVPARKAGTGIADVVAVERALLGNQIGLLVLETEQDFRARGRRTGLGLLRRHREVDQAEADLDLGGEDSGHLLGLHHAGQEDPDAVRCRQAGRWRA
ncbi:hypothetical protein BRDID11002_28550 [Bradyrhizobium diazoefficiens]